MTTPSNKSSAEEYAADELPDPVGKLILGKLSLGLLKDFYLDELRYRYGRAIFAFDHSQKLTELRESFRSEILDCVGLMKAAESWAGVFYIVFNQRLSPSVLYVGAAFALFMPLWLVSKTSVIYLLAACAALIAVQLMFVAFIHLSYRSDAKTVTKIKKVSKIEPWLWRGFILVSIVGLLINIPTHLALSVGGIAFILLATWAWYTSDVDETDKRSFAFVLALVVTTGTVLPHFWLTPSQSTWQLALSAFLAFIGYLILVYIGWEAVDLINKRYPVLATATIIAILALGVLAVRFTAHSPTIVTNAIRAAVVPAISAVVLLVLIGVISSVARIILWRWKEGWNPRADIVDTLLAILLVLEYGPEYNVLDIKLPGDEKLAKLDALRKSFDLRDVAVQDSVSSQLQYIAQLIRQHLLRQLGKSAPRLRLQLSRHLLSMNAAVEKWVYSATIEGAEGLGSIHGNLLQAIDASVRSHWEQFPRLDDREEQERNSRTLTAQVVVAVRSLVAASLPLVGAIVISILHLQVPAVALGSLYAFAVTLLTVAILRLIDPHAGENVDIAGKGFDRFRPGK
jgi:hypothetical protein